MIYLDNAATTPVDPRVYEEMRPFFTELYGNPNSMHVIGGFAKSAVQKARERVANLICASPEEIIFTSGGTEANNLAIAGMAEYIDISVPDAYKNIAISDTEHSSIKCSARRIETLSNLDLSFRGFSTSTIGAANDGTIPVANVREAIYNGACFISVMFVNNETGAINDICSIGELCSNNDVFFHTDCVQAAPFMEIDVNRFKCDALSLSSHKLHGPKGVGALYLNKEAVIFQQICGGNQEYGIRGGTLNVPGIVGFGKACEIAKIEMELCNKRLINQKQKFMEVLASRLESYGIRNIFHINGNSVENRGGILNITFDGIDGETLMLYLSANNVCISTGSACNSGKQKPSETLLAMGLTEEQAHQSVRFSFSSMADNTKDVEDAACIVSEAIKFLLNNS